LAAAALLQTLLTGHLVQCATRAVQMSAPNSISAWFCAYATVPARGSVDSAIAHAVRRPRGVLGSRRGANTRVRTRATLVSTSAARRSYANDATAPAV
jgi:hypothetical protein